MYDAGVLVQHGGVSCVGERDVAVVVRFPWDICPERLSVRLRRGA